MLDYQELVRRNEESMARKQREVREAAQKVLDDHGIDENHSVTGDVLKKLMIEAIYVSRR